MSLKIIHIVLGKANPNRANGVNKVVNNIANYQVEQGMNIELWGISFSSKHNYPKRNYKTLLFLDHKTRFIISPALIKAIKQEKGNPVVFHLHGGFIPQFYSISTLLNELKIPYVFTPHGAYNIVALKKNKWLKHIYIKLFEKKLVNQAKAIQLLGKSEQIGTNKYFSNQTFLIPNGQTYLKSETKKNNHDQWLNIGFLGRIDIHTKGLDILLTALKSIHDVIPVQLHIIGKGGEINQLKNLVKKLNIHKSVIFRGALFGEEKMKALSELDVLCLTSRNEGLPGVILEAASVKTPSLVSKETNMGEYIAQFKSGWVLENNTKEQQYSSPVVWCPVCHQLIPALLSYRRLCPGRWRIA